MSRRYWAESDDAAILLAAIILFVGTAVVIAAWMSLLVNALR